MASFILPPIQATPVAHAGTVEEKTTELYSGVTGSLFLRKLLYHNELRSLFMAAVLERNRADGKPVVLPDRMDHSEPIQCSGCSVSYTLAYGATEHRIQDGQNVVEVMRRTARDLVSAIHRSHEIEMYVWGGIYKGWLDSEQAKAAGL